MDKQLQGIHPFHFHRCDGAGSNLPAALPHSGSFVSAIFLLRIPHRCQTLRSIAGLPDRSYRFPPAFSSLHRLRRKHRQLSQPGLILGKWRGLRF